jgi:hypothetical protein
MQNIPPNLHLLDFPIYEKKSYTHATLIGTLNFCHFVGVNSSLPSVTNEHTSSSTSTRAQLHYVLQMSTLLQIQVQGLNSIMLNSIMCYK